AAVPTTCGTVEKDDVSRAATTRRRITRARRAGCVTRIQSRRRGLLDRRVTAALGTARYRLASFVIHDRTGPTRGWNRNAGVERGAIAVLTVDLVIAVVVLTVRTVFVAG